MKTLISSCDKMADFEDRLMEWVVQSLGWTVEAVTRAATQIWFAVQPRRWVAECTLA